MTETAFSDSIELMAGLLSVVFEPQSGMLRYVRIGDVELVRGVYAAVRDQDWNTVPFTVHDLRVFRAQDAFSVLFRATCSHKDIRFEWYGEIVGTNAGSIRYEFRGQAKSTFLKNRIGLCVLLPIEECAGQPCTVEHTGGSTTEGVYPKWIAPHQPFKNIHAITHAVGTDLRVRVALIGDMFEMEDQRNWSDASFKIYGTPLDQPFPVEITEGSRVYHSVAIELLGDQSQRGKSAATQEEKTAVTIHVDWEQSRRLPPIGLSMATCRDPLTAAGVERLRTIKPSHLRVDLNLDRDDWEAVVDEAIELANSTTSPLEIALFASKIQNEVWNRCLRRLTPERGQIARWLVFHSKERTTPGRMAEEAVRSLREFSPEIPVVIGTNAYFAELNRDRPLIPNGCLVGFSLNPQVHAFDNRSLSETLECLPWMVESAAHVFGKPVVVSPITLRPRFNPNATSGVLCENLHEPEGDPRQSSPFGAAWTVGVLAQLAWHANIASLTFYETFGPRGIMSGSGLEYPMAAVFELLGESATIYDARSDSTLEVAALALATEGGRRRIMLANLSDRKQNVRLEGLESQAIQIVLEEQSIRIVHVETSP